MGDCKSLSGGAGTPILDTTSILVAAMRVKERHRSVYAQATLA